MKKYALVAMCVVMFVLVWLPGCGDIEDDSTGIDDTISDDDPDEDNGEKPFEEPTFNPEDCDGEEEIEIESGEMVMMEPEESDDEMNQKSFYYSEMSVPTISTGHYRDYYLTISGGEVPMAWSIPESYSDDVDIYLYKGSNRIAYSNNWGGRIDRIIPKMSLRSGTYKFRFYCYSGPCHVGIVLSKGSESKFQTYVPYDNQRSYTAVSGKCKYDDRSVSDGECMCSDSSAAMHVVAAGNRRIIDQRQIAKNLFQRANRWDGAAVYSKLMEVLEDQYGFEDCYYTSGGDLFGKIQWELMMGKLVLFRSTSLSSYGHYVAVTGFKESGRKLAVNDPNGKWYRTNRWSPQNTTSEGSAYGRQLWLYFDTIAARDAGAVICEPD